MMLGALFIVAPPLVYPFIQSIRHCREPQSWRRHGPTMGVFGTIRDIGAVRPAA